MARFGIPSQGRDALAYVDSRLTGVPTVDSARDPTVNDTNYPIQTIWRNSTLLKECILVGFTNGQAQWRCFTDSDGTVLELLADDGNTVQPNAGVITVQGQTVNSGILSKPVFTNGATANTLIHQVQLGVAVGPTPADNTDAGLLSANNNQFTVDATSGMFSLKGNTTDQAIQALDVDFNTAPGTDPVVANASGQVQIFGNVVTNGTNLDGGGDPVPIATHSRAASQTHIDVQLTTAINASPGDPDDVGLASFDNIYFNADSNGNVSYNFEKLKNADVGSTYNLGLFYSSPTLTLKSADGTDLSATNPGFVVLPSNVTDGVKVVKKITSNFSFQDSGGTNDLNGSTFGLGVTDNWGTNDIPFYVMAILKDDDSDVSIAITRDPGRSNSSVVGETSYIGGGTNTMQGAFFYWEDLTAGGGAVADWAVQHTAPIGAIRMRTTNGGSAWVVQNVTGSTGTGIGRFMEHFLFNFPPGVFGASANSFMLPNGNTAPTFSTVNKYKYCVAKSGQVHLTIFFSGDAGTDGSGAVNAQVAMPYVSIDAYDLGSMRIINPTLSTLAQAVAISNQNYFIMYEEGLNISQLADYTNGTRQVSGYLSVFPKSA